jgi:hypothetical protein
MAAKVAMESASSATATGIHDQCAWPSLPSDEANAPRLLRTRRRNAVTVNTLMPTRIPCLVLRLTTGTAVAWADVFGSTLSDDPFAANI